MERPTITRRGSHPEFAKTETVQVEKRGGPLGSAPRYYVVSRADLTERDPDCRAFCDLVDTLNVLTGYTKVGDTVIETLAFRIPALGQEPENFTEVAGHPRNGASIEQVIEQILRDDGL